MSHSHQLAPFGRRVIAFVIELAILFGIISAFLFVSMGAIPEEKRTSAEGQTSIADKYELIAYGDALMDPSLWQTTVKSMFKRFPTQMLTGVFVIPILLFVLFDVLFGGSIGKLLTGIRVRKKDGGKISWASAFARAIGKLISILLLFLGCLLALFDKKNQALHDKIANTLVLKK